MNIHQIYLKISLWEYNLYRNKNNQKPYMIDENQRCKIVASLKSLRKFTSNKHFYKIRYFVNIFITLEDGFWNVNPKY